MPADDDDWDDDRPRRRSRYDRPDYSDSPHRGGLILGLGIGSLVVSIVGCPPVGLILGLMAWRWGRGDLRRMDAGEMDPDGRGITQAGWVCGLIGAIVGGLYMLLILAYVAFFAFVIAVVPPPAPPPPPRTPPPPAPVVQPAPAPRPAPPGALPLAL